MLGEGSTFTAPCSSMVDCTREGVSGSGLVSGMCLGGVDGAGLVLMEPIFCCVVFLCVAHKSKHSFSHLVEREVPAERFFLDCGDEDGVRGDDWGLWGGEWASEMSL